MKNQAIKKYELMVSKAFLHTHPRKGQPTGFAEKINDQEKIHTLRGNYELWKKRMDEVNAGTAVIVVKQWNGRPYWTGKTVLFYLKKGSVQKYQVSKFERAMQIEVEPGEMLWFDKYDVARNDGLSHADFQGWFFPKKITEASGAVIHFTDFRYVRQQTSL